MIIKTQILKLIISVAIFICMVCFTTNIKANSDGPTCIPSGCNIPCNSAQDTNCYEPDFACINEQLVNPSARNLNSPDYCCENLCRGLSDFDDKNPDEFQKLFEIFGQDLIIKTRDPLKFIASLINLFISTALGFASIYAVFYGVYVAGFQRARATSDEEIISANKTLVTIIAGFILAWSFIFIIQVVASILGLGSLNSLELVDSESAPSVTIE